jgi:hypothetical protein
MTYLRIDMNPSGGWLWKNQLVFSPPVGFRYQGFLISKTFFKNNIFVRNDELKTT